MEALLDFVAARKDALLLAARVLGGLAAAGTAFFLHTHFNSRKYYQYPYILKNKMFMNGGSGFLNMGVWIKDSLRGLAGNDKAVLAAVREAVERQSACANEDDREKLPFREAQVRMYELFYTLGNLNTKGLKVLETGGGTCEHYLELANMGMDVESLNCYEKCLEPSQKLLDGIAQADKSSVLHRIKLHHRLAHSIASEPNEYDRIMAVESAFHYPDRKGFFKLCNDALRPGGKLIMTDIIANEDFSGNFIWRLIWKYYWRHVIFTPSENVIGFKEYEKQLRGSGFSKVEVIDITSISLRRFYAQLDDLVNTLDAPAYVVRMNQLICKALSSCDKGKYPMKYTLAVCTK